MGHARATIAGVLATGIVLLMVFPSDTLREPERALAALVGLLAVVGLLVDVDILKAWRDRRQKPPDEPAP